MRVIGMMSGTSVDGIDVVVADIAESTPLLDPMRIADGQLGLQTAPPLAIQQIAFATVPWEQAFRRQLFALFHEATTAATLCRANFVVAEVFADTAKQFLQDQAIEPKTVDLIASHGQTIWHDVVDGKVTSTLQIGDPSVIATRTGITTIGNFRTADVAAGGQGAPLVSLYDWYFLRPVGTTTNAQDESNARGNEQWRAVQNIGGIGNVTFLPSYGSDQPPLAFDTGPGNVFIDWAVERVTDGQQQFDRDGALAAAGTPSAALLNRCLTLPYFGQMPPKSTGRELFDKRLAEQWWTIAQEEGLSAVDFVATMTELTAITIADAYRRFATGPLTEVIVAGGGARNPILLQRLRRQLQQKLGRTVPVHTHADLGIDDKAKEALAFALIGYLALHGNAGNVPACTGAATPQILGQIAPGSNFRSLLSRLH